MMEAEISKKVYEKLEYRVLQNLAKKYGIMANLSKKEIIENLPVNTLKIKIELVE